MKYALIGCGRISPNHITAALQNRLEIVALCDILPEAASALKQRFPELSGVKVYTDHREMLCAEKPELVAVATSSGAHASIAVDCIRAGSSVIIEKPIALSLADADLILSEAEKHRVKVCANHQNRFNESVQAIRSAVENGRFGRLHHATAQIRWNRSKAYYDQAPWRGTWAEDGGCLMNQCIHNIDLLNWMLGSEPVSVTAVTDNLNHSYVEGEDLGLAIIRYQNGAYGTVEGTVNVFGGDLEEVLCLFGETGTVKAGGAINDVIEAWRFADAAPEEETAIKQRFFKAADHIYGCGHTPLYADMIDAIRNDRAPYVDGRAGRNALELVLAIYRSSLTGTAVSLPLEAASTLDFIGMFPINKKER